MFHSHTPPMIALRMVREITRSAGETEGYSSAAFWYKEHLCEMFWFRETLMWVTELALWACSIASFSCGAAAGPNASIIQSAYELEASSGSGLHDRGLKVIEASCDKPVDGRFLCQVTFLSVDDPNQRLYFDIVAVGRNERGWELKSGLCKR